jgi:hypothetical protein
MKYKVDWTSPTQGVRSTTVDALTLNTAREQVESMYRDLKGFKVVCISPVFEKKEYEEPETYSTSSQSDNRSSDPDDFNLSTIVGTAGICIGAFIALIGLFSLPSGIIALVIGGLIGWGGMQLGFWISDRGW